MKRKKTYHFIGIGGVSMSALAIILKSNGDNVQGSDSANSFYTKHLKEKDIKVFYGHKAENIENANIVVYTDAIKQENVELLKARQLNLPIFSRAEILKEISKKYKNVIAVSGSHGKTTTMGMLAEIFDQAGLEPTVHIGGRLKKFNGNYILGKNEFFITEACEYKNNYHSLSPTVGVILNIDKEHMDFFETYKSLLDSFEKFASNCQNLIKLDSVNIKHKKIIEFGETGYCAKNIKQKKDGQHVFSCFYNNKKLFKVKLKCIGIHNIYNALAAIAVSKHYNISNKTIKKSLSNFEGIARRFDIKKTKPLIIHDYAHHPVEIKSSIAAVRAFRKGRLIVIFQPHTYSRTKEFMDDFETAFDLASQVCIVKTYSAREKYVKSASAKALFNKIKQRMPNSEYFSSFNQAQEFIEEKTQGKDTILILGAGNIEKLADKF